MFNGVLVEEKKSFIDIFNFFAEVFLINLPDNYKDPKLSEDCRLKGNELLNSKNHDSKTHEMILSRYASSIALAPPSSEELALGYGNRSALLLHLSMFTECIQDVDRALEITKSNVLKTKLLCRKVKCLSAIGKKDNIEKTLKKAQHFYKQSEKSKKEGLMKLIEDARSYLNKENKIKETKNSSKTLPLEKSLNDFSSISVARNEKFGNYLTAAKDIEPGEVIFIEKPYVSSVYPEKVFMYCDHCLKLSWSTIPCDTCSICMYCSEKCKKEAWDEYHSIACSVIFKCEFFYQSDQNDLSRKILPVTVRTIILAIKEAGSIEKLKNNLEKLENNRGKILIF